VNAHPLHTLLAEHPALQNAQRIVVAVSGGPDSLVLLHALCQTRHAPALAVFHLDHGLRGAESAADAAFVHACCTAWNIPCHSEQADIPHEAPDHPNLSEAARVVRYRRLAHYAATCDADVVLVAHTRDDQTETVLMRLLRGSGVRGLAGMARSIPWQAWAAGVHGGRAALVRPLLDIDRSVIDAYVTAMELTPRSDPSNTKQTSFRVRVRTQHLPALRAEQPQLNRIVASTAQHLRDADAFIEAALDDVWPHLVDKAPDSPTIDRAVYAPLHRALQTAALRRLIQPCLGSLRGIDDEHIAVLHQALLDHSAPTTPLPKQLILQWDGNRARLQRRGALVLSPYAYTGAPCAIQPGSSVALAAAELICTHADAPTTQSPWAVTLHADHPYLLRTRLPGDVIGIGHGKHRRIQDVLVDAKIPAHQRATWPLVCNGTAVVWVVGVRVDPDACAGAGYRFEVTGLSGVRVARIERG
jgi:tRNA(Ile)-lysidine synthase